MIDIEKALDFIRDNASVLAKAKAERIYLWQWRKSKKALLMKKIDGPQHVRESHAYSHPDYIEILDGLKVVVEEEERLWWLMIAAQAKVEVWRSQQANARAVDRAHQ